MHKGSATGGKCEPAISSVRQDGQRAAPTSTVSTALWPQLLPDGSLLVITENERGDPEVAVLDVKSGDLKQLGLVGLVRPLCTDRTPPRPP